MQMLYHSDSYIVVQFDERAGGQRGGFEIVDKMARKETFIEGLVADTFRAGVQQLFDSEAPTQEAFDEYIGRFTQLAQQPLVMH